MAVSKGETENGPIEIGKDSIVKLDTKIEVPKEQLRSSEHLLLPHDSRSDVQRLVEGMALHQIDASPINLKLVQSNTDHVPSIDLGGFDGQGSRTARLYPSNQRNDAVMTALKQSQTHV